MDVKKEDFIKMFFETVNTYKELADNLGVSEACVIRTARALKPKRKPGRKVQDINII